MNNARPGAGYSRIGAFAMAMTKRASAAVTPERHINHGNASPRKVKHPGKPENTAPAAPKSNPKQRAGRKSSNNFL